MEPTEQEFIDAENRFFAQFRDRFGHFPHGYQWEVWMLADAERRALEDDDGE